MIQVKLMGEMGEKFGTDWVSADNNLRDIFKLIEAQTDGFAEYIGKNYNVKLDCITISKKQYEYSKERIHKEGLNESYSKYIP